MTTGSRIEVSSALAAWTMANAIFPGDFQKDTMSSERAGYPVYRSTVEYYDYICDLSNRLEINLKDGNRTINIWIVEQVGETQGIDITVEVTAMKSGEVRTYASYADFRKDYRFFLSSGKRYEDDENHFEKIISTLRLIDDHGTRTETVRYGMKIAFILKKW